MAWLDAGDFLHEPTEPGRIESATVVEGMRRLGVAAVNLGPRELSWGLDDAIEAASGLPLVSVNAAAGRGVPPFRTIEVPARPGRPFRIAVIGALAGGPEDPLPTLRRLVPELRRSHDFRVLLLAGEPADARRLARAVPGLDAILGAGRALAPPADVGGTVIAFPGRQGHRLAELRLHLRGREVLARSARLVVLAKELPPDPELDGLVKDTIARLNALRARGSGGEPRILRLTGDVLRAMRFRLQADEAPLDPDAACARCHADQAAAMAQGPHGAGSEVACTSCHGGAQDHLRAPATRPPAVPQQACAGCHAGAVGAAGDGASVDPHAVPRLAPQ